MTLRHLTLSGPTPMELDLDERLSFVQADDGTAALLIEALRDAGWRAESAEDMPGAVAVERVGGARGGARLSVEVAEAFCRAVEGERRANEVAIEALREQLRAADAATEMLAELRDVVIDELGRGAVPRPEAAARWERLWVLADQAGLTSAAADLRTWIADATAGRAPLHPVAVELSTQAADLEARWVEVGSGAFSEAAFVNTARSERDRLQTMTIELEALIEAGSSETVSERIEAAHARRLQAEDGRSRGLLEAARHDEEQLLGSYGFDGYPDFLIARSTGTLANHAETVLPGVSEQLERAGADLSAAIEEAEARGHEVAAQRAALADRIEAFSSGVPLDDLLAPPQAAEALVDACADQTEERNRQLADLATHVEELVARGHELDAEFDLWERNAASAKEMLVRFDEAVADLDARHARTVERVGSALADDSHAGLVVRAHSAQLAVPALADLLEGASTQVVVVSADAVPRRRMVTPG